MMVKPAILSMIGTAVAAETAKINTSVPTDEWYGKLKKSKLTPPSWVFGYAWAILYALIIMSFLVYISAKYTSTGIVLYIVQFAMNLMWSGIFFEQRRICTALALLATLNVLVFFTYREFVKTSSVAATLLLPYMAWILFALYLNYYICVNNI